MANQPSHLITGQKGENTAADYLIGKGYRILERNWHNYHEEIDIIAVKGTELVIVEVKCRTGNPVTEPYTAVTRKKQDLLIKAANAYITKHDLDMDTRFDVISIVIGAITQIEHIENAFYPKVGS